VALDEYKRKRRFAGTPEPAGPGASGRPAGHPPLFVVQKHRATRLHYDFRLAIHGVLVSWAVPKGPSLNPADKRLAVQTEDHPMDYGGFEGVIPEGNYGAGTVMLWDRGLFAMIGPHDAREQLYKGELKFRLHGEKLNGEFVLVKLKHAEKGNEWLMIKHKDAFVDAAYDVEAHDGSVLTGRTIPEITESAPPRRAPLPVSPAELERARSASMPADLKPMLATPLEHPFSSPEWLFEIKWDGVRAIAFLREGKVELRARSSIVITDRYPELATLPQQVAARDAIFDGEIVVLEENGRSDFERLQQRMHVRGPAPALQQSAPILYYIFDLLHCDGYDLRATPLEQRKALLRRILHPGPHARYSDEQRERGKELFELARAHGLEGILGKRADSIYAPGQRSPNWVKLKTSQDVDAVIGGWTEPRGSREHFGALLLGLYDKDKLVFIGNVGTGFTQQTLKEIAADLKKREVAKCQFAEVPDVIEKPYWTRPERVARVRYAGWTNEKRLRHPSFVGLRDDKRAAECRLDAETMSNAQPGEKGPAPEPPVVVTSPSIAGRVISKKSQIEAELFKGKADNIIIEVEGKKVRLSNLNKVYFPEPNLTKRHLLAYFYRVADFILPFLRERPMVLRRYPDGVKGQAFFQKDFRDAPDWMETILIPSDGKQDETQYVTANDLPSLLFLTNLGCMDHNPWSSRRDDLEHPDFFFFDLDPSDGTDFSVVVTLARALHEKLDELGVKHFLKTSGASGFHIYVPVERAYTYEQLRAFAEIVARLVSGAHPQLVTYERTVSKRPAGRVLIDVHQNAQGRPLASAYSVRAAAPAPVSTPVLPRELRESLRPEKFNVKTIDVRIEKVGDLWRDFWKSAQRLEPAIEKLGGEMKKSEKARK